VEYYLRTTWGKYTGTWGTNWELHSLLVGAWWEQIEKRLGTSEIYKNKTNKKKSPLGWG
jgi:hypothetical protein